MLNTSGSYETGSDDNSVGMGGREEEVGEHRRAIRCMFMVNCGEPEEK